MYKELSKITLTSRSWILSQVAFILNESIMGFLTAILILVGISEQNILLVFCSMYFCAANIIYFSKTHVVKSERVYYNIGFILTFVLIVLGLCNDGLYKSSSIVAAGVLVLVLKDLYSVGNFVDIDKVSKNRNVNPIKLLTFSFILSMVVISITMPLLGSVFDYNPDILSIFIMCSLGALFLFNNRKDKFIKEEGLLSGSISKTPKSIILQCSLSLAYNAVSFLSVRFIIPLIIIESSVKYGLEDGVFKYIGLFIGFVALLSILSRMKSPKTNVKSINLMMVNYVIGIVSYIVIGVIYYFMDISENNTYLPVYLLMLLLIIAVNNFTSKLWSVGFIEFLREQSSNYSVKGVNEYNRYLTLFMVFKNYGVFIGFVLSYFLCFWFDVSLSLVILGLVSLLYGFFTWFYIKKVEKI